MVPPCQEAPPKAAAFDKDALKKLAEQAGLPALGFVRLASPCPACPCESLEAAKNAEQEEKDAQDREVQEKIAAEAGDVVGDFVGTCASSLREEKKEL